VLTPFFLRADAAFCPRQFNGPLFSSPSDDQRTLPPETPGFFPFPPAIQTCSREGVSVLSLGITLGLSFPSKYSAASPLLCLIRRMFPFFLHHPRSSDRPHVKPQPSLFCLLKISRSGLCSSLFPNRFVFTLTFLFFPIPTRLPSVRPPPPTSRSRITSAGKLPLGTGP